MTIKAIVFDLDGTLAEFNLDYKMVRAEVIQFLVNRGFPASVFSINESIFEMLKKAKVYMENNGREKGFSDVRKHVFSLARQHELRAARGTSLIPGAYATLEALKKMNLKLAIFTINSEDSANLILERFRLRQFFDAIITRESVPGVKPDPSHLAAALKALDVDVEEAIVVGDSIVDMKSAKALNAIAVGLAADEEVTKNLNHAGAAHLIKSITDLPVLVNELSKAQL